ncbi:hypothetical protein AYR62_01045 [Secundilactobacillus paracollinoides]|uniref:Peptidase M10 metallopeptidase domain-containing protein n=1 Tax=Secundilactobacillus paracollinoides TaxID=240427 RepID=A0A1B2IVE4_9LACO|nr:matrixin family metalloprotease [Secundilactobacillus paracollinoides]ANZ60220.1 hypothetical protein AYR61_01875 [Secundilactobacillus paracollinoides]ANZ62825.1 hypothetical protein AYR62_01045 [Secundilactobacillus paracollinoides]ANZ66015.1 hypothetical protein AYR63_01895 [Secundilactobacillus paracollinoides]
MRKWRVIEIIVLGLICGLIAKPVSVDASKVTISNVKQVSSWSVTIKPNTKGYVFHTKKTSFNPEKMIPSKMTSLNSFVKYGSTDSQYTLHTSESMLIKVGNQKAQRLSEVMMYNSGTTYFIYTASQNINKIGLQSPLHPKFTLIPLPYNSYNYKNTSLALLNKYAGNKSPIKNGLKHPVKYFKQLNYAETNFGIGDVSNHFIKHQAQVKVLDKNLLTPTKKAIAAWNKAMGKKIFILDQKSSDRSFVVDFNDWSKMPADISDAVGVYDSDDNIDYKGETITWSVFIRDGEVEKSDLQGVLEHEFGHAMGLTHSKLKSDIMYSKSGQKKISKRDLDRAKIAHYLGAW